MKQPLRILFMGTPDFAVPSLTSLLGWDGCRVVAVVSQPDRPRGRGRKLVPTPVKQTALAAKIPVLQPEKIRTDEFLQTLAAFSPDILVVAAYGRILPASLLSLPPQGVINVHGSLLPKYRGAAPIQWAIIRGERETGVTIMEVVQEMDAGDILLTRTLSITDTDTAGTIFRRMARLGGEALVEALELLRQGKLVSQPQDHTLATEAPPLTKKDGLVNWARPAWEISCQVRGTDPWPGAYTFTPDGRMLKLFSPVVTMQAATEARPGTVMAVIADGLAVATGDTLLCFREVQPQGKRRMSAADWVNGRGIEIGDRLVSESAP